MVVIVAFFVVLRITTRNGAIFHDAVTTDAFLEFARSVATVEVDFVHVVALFDVLLNETVAAISRYTTLNASVGVVLIAVVANFSGIGLEVAVTAGRCRAVAEASVCVDLVAVVALLANLNDAVAARDGATKVRAGIGVHIVAVVANFALLNETVAAGRSNASIEASVSVDAIAVIANFVRIGLDKTVTARSCEAGVEASIGVAQVAVVADFVAFDSAVTTGGKCASVASIGSNVVAIVASFHANVHEVVTTERIGANTEASVIVVLVAVVASFNGETIDEINASETIATRSVEAGVEASVVVGEVAIVARFAIFNNTVTTRSRTTSIGATVFVHGVAIVASFVANPYEIVAAGSRYATFDARVVIDRIAVVTNFNIATGGLTETVATGSVEACVQTSVSVVAVVVVAFLASLNDAVAAAFEGADAGATVAISGV